ncbi:hypothetical protein ES702_03641 [subsurface metagenome]
MITTKEVARRLGKSHRTIRLWCQNGKLDCEKVGKNWQVDEKKLDEFLTVKVIGNNETVRQKGKVKETSKDLELPPYYLLVRQLGFLEGKVEMLEKENTLLKEQLTYQKTSWIRKLFKR